MCPAGIILVLNHGHCPNKISNFNVLSFAASPDNISDKNLALADNVRLYVSLADIRDIRSEFICLNKGETSGSLGRPSRSC